MNDKTRHIARHLVAWALLLLLVAAVAWLKYPRGEYNYLNSDATWHVVLAMNAYDETPVSVHKFLPLVSLGDARDKGISWGAAVWDQQGNYYYTSFSSMGFALPYLVLKLLHLPFTPQSLYLFNTGLLWLSCGIVYELLSLWSGPRRRQWLMAVVLVAYVLTPEIMHGMGLTYWHQSLMQVFLPLQLLLYYRWATTGRGFWAFAVLCLVCPYTEWSGYVANAGYFLAEGYRWAKDHDKRHGKSLAVIAAATVLAGVIFCVQYLPVVGLENLFLIVGERFVARSVSQNKTVFDLLAGYWVSAKALLLLAGACLVVWAVLRLTGLRRGEAYTREQKLVVFLAVFPLLENLLMQQHALSYTYDRMKIALPLLLLLYGLLYSITAGRRAWLAGAGALVVLVVCFFARQYRTDTHFVWATDYKAGNEALFAYLDENFDDSVLGCTAPVRGYVNMLAGRGCYEQVSDPYQLEEQAAEQDVRYIVLLTQQDAAGTDGGYCYCLGAQVLDRTTGQLCTITNLHSGIEVSDWQ